MRRLLAGGLVALSVHVPWAHATEQVPLYRDVKDWVVGCDNTHQCSALATAGAFDALPWSLRITREAGPEAVPRVSLFSFSDVQGTPLLDGKPLTSHLQKGEADNGEDWYATGSDALALIDELRNGRQLTVATNDGNAIASLDGISAALLLIDSVQERVGTQTALLRRGQRPDSSVPPAPAAPPLPAFQPVPQLSEADAQRIGDAVIAATRKDWEWQSEPEDRNRIEAHSYALGPDAALVIVQTACAAYNCAFMLYQTSRSHPEQAQEAHIFRFPGELDDEPSGYVDYNPNTGDLSSFSKGRGLGDCGIAQSWQYDGNAFQPKRLARMDSCAGSESGGWPVLWRSAKQ